MRPTYALETYASDQKAMKKVRDFASALQASIELENKKVILDLIEPDEDAKVLDIGCGSCDFTIQFARRVGTLDIHGIELVASFIEQCVQKGVQMHRADVNEPIPLEAASFDVVVTNQLLEHLNNTDLFITEIHRVLKPGGYAIISTPNLASWHNVGSLLLGWQPFATSLSDEINVGNPFHTRYKMRAAGGKYPSHRRIATYRGLRELVEYYGFGIETMIGVGWYPLPARFSRIASRLDPRHSAYLTVKARKSHVARSVR